MADVRPIDANALLRFIDEQMEVTKRIERNTMGIEADGTALMDLIRYQVTSAPTIDYAPVVHAHWIATDGFEQETNEREFKCSNCGKVDKQGIWSDVPYCWHCGARMDEQIGGGDAV